MHGSIRRREGTVATICLMSRTQSPFSLVMRNALAGIKLGQASIDLRQKHESVDGIVERGIRREIPERL